MAYTSIIPVRRLDRAVDYVRNKTKTTRGPKSLQDAVDYALNREKTESDCFETGLSCVCETAFEDMRDTVQRWQQTDGVQGYHLVQSFAEGEVTPELAHQIGVELAEQLVSTVINQSGVSGMSAVTLPQDLIDAINQVGFWDSIPLWAVTLIGGLLITVLSFVMILTVYGRMFSLWMYAAIAPIPLSSFAGEPTSNVGKNFLRSYAGVCLQGVVIALACIIFSAVSSSPPAVDTSVSVVTAVWTYVGELAFNLLVLVGAVKGCDRIVKEIMGL